LQAALQGGVARGARPLVAKDHASSRVWVRLVLTRNWVSAASSS
jgi:hypothetical protein